MRELEREVCSVICSHQGIRAREIAQLLGAERQSVNHILYSSPLMKELCWQDRDYKWHGLVSQSIPHAGLEEFAAWYGHVKRFVSLTEEQWMEQMTAGCVNIGRNLNDTRGLLHSFRDCRAQMTALFADLRDMLGDSCLEWEIAFELRLKSSRHVRIYADVLVITENRVFSFEFKMKDAVDSAEVLQAAKYTPYLEIVFGKDWEVIPVLVLTKTRERFSFVRIGDTDRVLPVCSGDMLFNVFDEYLGFLN